MPYTGPIPKNNQQALNELWKRSDSVWQALYGNLFWKKKLLDVEVGDGPCLAFDMAEFQKRMGSSNGKANGFAIPMYWSQVHRVCLGYSICILEIEAHAKSYYDVMTLAEQCLPVEWTQPVLIGCTSQQTPGEKGCWRRLSGDRDIFAVLWQLVRVHELQANNAREKELQTKAMSMLMSMISHMPVDFICIDDKINVEQAYFKHSYQHRETLLINAENEAPSCWEIFANYAEIRSQKQSSGVIASDEAVEEFFTQNIVQSKMSSQDHKGIKIGTCLKAFDKLIEADVSHLCAAAKAVHGLKSPLTMMTKLVHICQKCGTEPQRVSLAIQYFHVRLMNESFDKNMPMSDVKTTMIQVNKVYEVQTTMIKKILQYESTKTYDHQKDAEWSLRAASEPEWLVEQNELVKQCHININATPWLHLQGSCQYFFRWCVEVVDGTHDNIWKELAANFPKA